MTDRRLVLLPDGIPRWLCLKCHVPKEKQHFYSAGRRAGGAGLYPDCKPCTNELHRTRYAALHREANRRFRERERIKRDAERARRIKERSSWTPRVTVEEARTRCARLDAGLPLDDPLDNGVQSC